VGVGGYEDIEPDRTGQAEASDAIADRYGAAFSHPVGQLTAGKWLIGLLPCDSRVLDVGCVTGFPTSRQLQAAGHRTVGIDWSAGLVGLARSCVPRAELHQADIADLRPGRPYGAGGSHDLGKFDAVTAFFSLLVLPRAEIPYALDTIQDLLVPGGLLALSMLEADLDDFAIPFPGNTIRVSGYLRDDLRDVASEAGFEVLEEESYAYVPTSVDVPPEEQLFLHCRQRA
jgi:SAM-dependent methyltransferase